MELINPQNNESGPTIIIERETPKTNGIGTAGFIMSLIAVFLGWIPVLGWILWLLGLVFSFVGLFKSPRGFAVAGFIISLVGLMFLLVIFAWITEMAGLSGLPMM